MTDTPRGKTCRRGFWTTKPCVICGQHFDLREHPRKKPNPRVTCSPECSDARHRQQIIKWNKSEKGRSHYRQYEASRRKRPEIRLKLLANSARYRRSEKGQIANAKNKLIHIVRYNAKNLLEAENVTL